MKNIISHFLFSFIFLVGSLHSQSINLAFSGMDSVTQEALSLDSILVSNSTIGCDTIIYGDVPTLTIMVQTGLEEYSGQGQNPLTLSPPYPNPVRGTAYFELTMNVPGQVRISLHDQLGRLLATHQGSMEQGTHSFQFESSESSILILNASTPTYSTSKKLINIDKGGGKNLIDYLGSKTEMLKSFSTYSGFIFNLGDQLSYTTLKEGYYEEIIYDSPTHDTAYTFSMNNIPMDGFYVRGPATAYNVLHENAMMKVTRNEVTQLTDSNLFELYVPVVAAADGFNIVEVSGSDMTTYGPDSDFEWVYNGLPYEPEVPFQRGSYIVDDNPFTVTDDGMYHVAIYMPTQKVVVVPVHWGIIGPATINGWNSSTPLDESDFNLHSMSWSLDSLELFAGDWKYRYSDGWKVFLDTTIVLSGGKKGISVNANFGGSIDSLVPGGDNIFNSEPGIYTNTLEYTLGSAYEATLTKTDSLPYTNWVGVVCDAVGTGISSDNINAVPDPSGWGWGNRIVADNGGVPTSIGYNYTWTWTSVIIEAHEGFKVRTLDGEPSPVNGMNFDAGYLDLNVAASAPQIYNGGPPNFNLMSTIKASYTIVLHIDASNNNQKELIITMD